MKKKTKKNAEIHVDIHSHNEAKKNPYITNRERRLWVLHWQPLNKKFKDSGYTEKRFIKDFRDLIDATITSQVPDMKPKPKTTRKKKYEPFKNPQISEAEDGGKLAVANEILRQLGGNKFIAMTGAKLFVGDKESLSFKLPARFAKRGINYVKIVLTPRDDYDLFFGKIKGYHSVEIDSASGVYADQLQAVFKEKTGLDTSLNPCGTKKKNPVSLRIEKDGSVVWYSPIKKKMMKATGAGTVPDAEIRAMSDKDARKIADERKRWREMLTPKGNPAPIELPFEVAYLGEAVELKTAAGTVNVKGAGLFCDKSATTLFILPMKRKKAASGVYDHSCKKVFEKWAQYKASEVFKVTIPQLGNFFFMAKAKSLVYDSDKWMEKGVRYVHDFKNAEVFMAYAEGKAVPKAFAIRRKDGEILVTARGVIG